MGDETVTARRRVGLAITAGDDGRATVGLPVRRRRARTDAVLDRLAAHAAALPRSALYLIPLRIFLGLGWLRAGIEKVIDPQWWSGAGVRTFVDAQLAGGHALPPVRPLLEGPVTDAAVAVAAVVAATQVIIGACILLGWRTTPALFAGIAMNLVFVVSGQTNPSVFYLLVAWPLLVGGAGSLFGLDAARAPVTDVLKLDWSAGVWVVVTAVALGAAAVLTPFVVETAPARVVEDPALILITMALLVAGTSAVAGLRARARTLRPGGDPPQPRRCC